MQNISYVFVNGVPVIIKQGETAASVRERESMTPGEYLESIGAA
jgi:hypothetical protein